MFQFIEPQRVLRYTEGRFKLRALPDAGLREGRFDVFFVVEFP
jgi:hypothetical protein